MRDGSHGAPGIGCEEADGYTGAWHARGGRGGAQRGREGRRGNHTSGVDEGNQKTFCNRRKLGFITGCNRKLGFIKGCNKKLGLMAATSSPIAVAPVPDYQRLWRGKPAVSDPLHGYSQ